MSIQATGPWVFIKVDKPTNVTKGGLIIPDDNFEQKVGYSTATVLSVGRGKWNEKKRVFIHSGLKEGDKVLFRSYLQVVHKPQQFDDDHCFIHQDDILMKEEPDAPSA